MQLRGISIKWKLSVPIILLIIIGVTMTTFATGYKTDSSVLHDVGHSALIAYRDTILNTQTAMMPANNIPENKGPFFEQMQQVVDLKVLRSKNVNNDFGKRNTND